MSTKKIILIVVILILVGVAAFFIYSARQQEGGGGSDSGFSVRDFFPFGQSSNNNLDYSAGDTNPDQSIDDILPPIQELPKLRKLSKEPVAGAIIFDIGTTTKIRFVEKSGGNVFEVSANATTITRLTNTTIPKITRATWLKDGSGFLAQKLNENGVIETSFVSLKLKTQDEREAEDPIPYNTLESNLPTGIREIAVSPDSKKIFYYTTPNGTLNGVVANPDGTSPKTIYTSDITEWIPEWSLANSITLNAKNSALTPSFGLKINASTGASSKSIGSIQSRVLPEKCVVSNEDSTFIFCGVPKSAPSGLPDSWYQGRVSTNDLLEKINVEENYLFTLSDLSAEAGSNIDIYKPLLSSRDNYIIFTNKIDQSLWLLKL